MFKDSINENTLTHASLGGYIKNKLRSGGHGQEAINYMNKKKISYVIDNYYLNGVRLGQVIDSAKSRGIPNGIQCWFPKNWNRDDIKRLGRSY